MRLSDVFNPSQPKKVCEQQFRDWTNVAARRWSKRLLEQCRPWLNETNNGSLIVYRGIKERFEKSVAKKRVRKNRRPLDSTIEWHKLFNLLIKEKGLTANRSNSISVVSDQHEASAYGNEYVVIPIGDFYYTWHEDVDDWYVYWQDKQKDLSKFLGGNLPRDLEKQVRHYVKRWVDNSDAGKWYLNTIQHCHERLKKEKDENERARLARLSRTAKEDYNYLLKKKIDLELKRRQYLRPNSRKEVLKGLHGDDGSLPEAIRSGNEIMIKCDYVYYIEPLYYKKLLLPLLQN